MARLDLALEIAGRNKNLAYLELAGTWGGTSVGFATVEQVEAERGSIPPLVELLPLIDGHPAYGRFDAEYQALCALVDLEHANAVPDLELFGGLTRLNETQETVFNIGVAWSLTTQHKNEGKIRAAGALSLADGHSSPRRPVQ